MEVHPLYEQFVATGQALANAQAAHDQAKAALLAAMPEGIEVSTVEQHPPILKRVGSEVVVVNHPFLGTPIPEPA